MFVIFTVLALILMTIYSIKKPPKFPPGPRWLPLVGSLPRLQKLSKSLGGQHLALQELSKEWQSSVIGLKLGKELFVVVSSYTALKAVFTGDEYDGRPDNFFLRLRTMGTRKGITCTDGKFWKDQRSFVVRHLRGAGFGKSAMETIIKDEIRDVIGRIGSTGETTVDIGGLLAPAVLNVLWFLVAGARIGMENGRLNKLLALLNKRSKAFDMAGGALSRYPWLRFIAPERSGYNLITNLNAELKAFLMKTIEEHHKNWYAGRDDDVIYAFITEMKKANDDCSDFTDEQLLMICLDLFIAGANTTSSTLEFACFMMLLYPEVQQKLHQVLDEQFNQEDAVNYADRYRIPYVEAVLCEVQRYCHVVPIVGPRRVLRDTELEGYHIPKNTTILMNLYSLFTSKEIWNDPEKFRPERFLDEAGRFIQNEAFLPLGFGKRRCLGESLARNVMFIFFVETLRKFAISPATGKPVPPLKSLPGIVLSPPKYPAEYIRR